MVCVGDGAGIFTCALIAKIDDASMHVKNNFFIFFNLSYDGLLKIDLDSLVKQAVVDELLLRMHLLFL